MEIEEVKNRIKELGFDILREEKIGDNIVIDFVDKSIKHELEPYRWFASSLSYNPHTKELEATIRKKIDEYANAEIFCDGEQFIPHVARYKEDDETIFSLQLTLKKNSLERFMDILNSIVVSSS
jgi:hypothetical protein